MERPLNTLICGGIASAGLTSYGGGDSCGRVQD